MFAMEAMEETFNETLTELEKLIQEWDTDLDSKSVKYETQDVKGTRELGHVMSPAYQPDSHTKPKETVMAKRDIEVEEERRLRQGQSFVQSNNRVDRTATVMTERFISRLPDMVRKRKLERVMVNLSAMYLSTQQMKHHVKSYNDTREKLVKHLVPDISRQAKSLGVADDEFIKTVLSPNSRNPKFTQLRQKLAELRGHPELATIRTDIRGENYKFMTHNNALETELNGISSAKPELMNRIRHRVDKRLHASIESIPDMHSLDLLDRNPNGQPRQSLIKEADRASLYMDTMVGKMSESVAKQSK